MGKLSQRFTYANVASTLALVVAIGGGGTAVALAVANNSVGSPQIIDGSIKHKDLTTGKIGVVRGYAWSGDASPPLDTPQVLTTYKYNSAGGSVQFTRTAVGEYTVSFANLNFGPGSVQVTAYGDDANYCKVFSWSGSSVNIDCYTSAGAKADSRWQVAVIE